MRRFIFVSGCLTIILFALSAVPTGAPHSGEVAPGIQYVMSVGADGETTECVAMDEAAFEQFFGISLRSAVLDEPDATFSNVVTASFDVTFTGFTAQAQAAFQHAVNILSSVVSSPVPIKVDAQFQALGPGILGSAGPNGFLRNATGFPLTDTFYPMALAESLIGVDTNLTPSDVNATLNSDFADWYFGTDGNPPAGKWDFVSVVLHELLHGLGFGDSFNVSGGQGSWGIGNPVSPFVFDLFVQNAAGQSLLDTSLFPNPSVALRNQLQSNNLYSGGFSSPRRVFAPIPFQPGSSIAHVDPTTFPQGNIDALMRPGIASGFAIHMLGPVTMDIFSNMGWSMSVPDEVTGCIFNCDVGIGTSSPARQLHLSGSNAAFRMDRTADTAAFLMVRTTPAGAPLKTFVVGTNASGANNGEFIINDLGTATGGAGVRRMTITNAGETHFTGTVRAPAFVTTSSLRYKEQVRTLQNAATIVDRLRGVGFVWKETGNPSVGLIAEEVAEVIPQAVRRDEEDQASGVDYAALVAVLVEAVKSQQQEIRTQRRELKLQKERMDFLYEEIETMKRIRVPSFEVRAGESAEQRGPGH